jgi:diguanylate cyclase (GGDEF)-like protein/PAS domain S-box-containing protein
MEASHTNGGNWSRALVSGFPGPALVADAHGRILQRNRAASGVLTVVEAAGERLRGDLGQRGATLALEGRSDRWVLALDPEPGEAARSFLLAVLCVPTEGDGEPVAVFLAWETTLEASLRAALVESRAFFRDLVTGSGDFVWAVDAEGVFTYASEAGFAGFGARQLHGMHWQDLFAAAADRVAAAEVFESAMAVEEVDLWAGAGDGRRCYRVHANPLIGPSGEQRGLRGVARDVTATRREEAEARAIRQVDSRVDGMLRDIGRETDPDAMLATAASSIVTAVGLDGCWIFQRRGAGPFDAETAATLHVVPQRHARASVQHAAVLRGLAARLRGDGAPETATESRDGWDFLAAPARQGGTVFGVLCLGRQSTTGRGTWDEADLRIIRRIADQVAVAIRMAEHQHQIRRLSRTDALTGLLTRQAFIDCAARRLAEHLAQQSPAALLLIDLDGLKDVNDLDGCGGGDRALTAVARAITTQLRPGAIAGRSGGDEFVLWLDGADAATARAMADALDAGSPAARVSLSIGISVLDPARPETFDGLMRRAERALDDAKAAGGSQTRVAAPVAKATSPLNQERDTVAGLPLEKVGP